MKYYLTFLKDNCQFQDIFNYIHLDEKWFYIAKTKQKFYLLSEGLESNCRVNSKLNVVKVIFLAVIGRSRFDFHKKKHFDGKVGIWLFVIKEPAKQQKSSKKYQKLSQRNVNNKEFITYNKSKMACRNGNDHYLA